MTRDQLAAVLAEEIERIAPDVDVASADRSADLREELEIDSMDFLNLVTALHKRLGIDIPESDYSELGTLDAAVAYLERRAS